MTDKAVQDSPIQHMIIPPNLLTKELLTQLEDLGLVMVQEGMIHAQSKNMGLGASIVQSRFYEDNRVMRNFFHVEAVRNGRVIWVEDFENLVVDVGLDDSLDKHLKGSGYTATWFVGLTDAATVTVVAGDTMSTHAGWVDTQTYSNGVRPTLTLGSVSSQSVDNSASVAAFNINGGQTFGGAFICSDNTVGGTSGILYGAGAFTGGDRAVINGDTVNVTVTLTAAAS